MHFWRFFVHITVLMLFMITLVSVSINNKCQCELVLLLWCWELTRVHARQASPSWQGLTWPRQALNSFCCQKWPWTPWSSPLCLLPLLFVPDTKRRILIVCVGHFRGWVAGFRPSSLWASEAKSGLVSLSALGRRHPSPAEALALPPLYLTRTLIRFHQAAPGLCLAHTWLITFSSVSPLLPHPGRWCLSHSLASGSSSSYLRVQKPDTCAVPSILPSSLCPKDNLSALSLIRTTENSCSLSLATHNLLALFSSCPEKRLIRGWNMFWVALFWVALFPLCRRRASWVLCHHQGSLMLSEFFFWASELKKVWEDEKPCSLVAHLLCHPSPHRGHICPSTQWTHALQCSFWRVMTPGLWLDCSCDYNRWQTVSSPILRLSEPLVLGNFQMPTWASLCLSAISQEAEGFSVYLPSDLDY